MAGLLDMRFGQVNGSTPSRLTKANYYPATEPNVRGVLDLATNIPVAGDVLSGLLAGYDAYQGDYGSAAANAVGLLPFVPAMGGVIKRSGNFSNKLLYPDEFKGIVSPARDLPKSDTYNQAGMIFGDSAASGQLRKIEDGDFLMTVSPTWPSKSKGFFAVGDDAEELALRGKEFMSNSGKSVQSARTAKIPKSIRSELESTFGKVFDYDISNAAKSGSYYVTHKPSGTKIRVSDHDLPAYYENTANIDIRDASEIVNALKEYLK